MAGKINSYNEWDPLEEIIVGVIENAQRPKRDKGQLLIEFFGKDTSEIPTGKFDDFVINETHEDLEILVKTLEDLHITVRRPEITDHSKTFATPDWSSDGFYNYCPRDPFLVSGDTLIESPMTLRSRYFEPNAYKTIFTDYLKSGSRWVSAPKPRLTEDTYIESDDEYKILNNIEPLFDAANVVRAGKDLFYLVSSSGNEMGHQWLQSFLGNEYTVHPCRNLYSSIHIDSTITLLRPGLVLLNPARVNEKNIPEKLKKWDKIWCPPLVDTGFVGPHAYSSIWVGMNLLMINPHLAIVDQRQQELIKALNTHEIEVIPLQLRHSRTLGGGFHCVTLDIRRKGKLENYFS